MSDKLHEGLTKAGVHKAQRHLFLCIGPDCCKTREGEFLWDYVKKRTKETGLRAMRTKAGCFRICTEGPWLVIYPDGTWYSQVTPNRFERILQEHLLGGTPVREWIVARNTLGCGSPGSGELPAQTLAQGGDPL
jgi:(2Fe-2S) ferredoxin